MTEEELNARQDKIEKILERMSSVLGRIEQLITIIESDRIGDWISEETAQRLTNMGKSSLYALRKSDTVTHSTITGKGVFYRISDFVEILNANETKRK